MVGGFHQHTAHRPGNAGFDRLPDLLGLSDDAIIAAATPLDDVRTHQFAVVAKSGNHAHHLQRCYRNALTIAVGIEHQRTPPRARRGLHHSCCFTGYVDAGRTTEAELIQHRVETVCADQFRQLQRAHIARIVEHLFRVDGTIAGAFQFDRRQP